MKYKELERKALRSFYTIRKVGVNTVIERENLIYNRTDRIIIDETREDKITISMLANNPNDFEFLTSALAYAETPLGERQEEKRYIIPLPHLKTSNGEQLFLTHQGNFFPHVRNTELRQTWKEKDLIHVPEEYRDFAVEIVEVERWN